MNEEEKQAIEYIKEELENEKKHHNHIYKGVTGLYGNNEVEIALKLIDKQQKEIENRLNEIKCLYNFISIREERIDELAEINEKYKDLEDDLTTAHMNGFFEGEKKWKDKIEDKIRYNKAFNDDVHIYTKLTLEELFDEEIEEE